MISANCSVFRFVPAACMKLQFNFSTCGHNSCPWLTITLQRRQNIVQTTYCGRVWWKQKLHPSGTSSVTIGCRKPSVRAPRWVGDAMVDRGNAGWTKSKSRHPCPCWYCSKSQKRLKENLCWIVRRVPPTTQSVKGLSGIEMWIKEQTNQVTACFSPEQTFHAVLMPSMDDAVEVRLSRHWINESMFQTSRGPVHRIDSKHSNVSRPRVNL